MNIWTALDATESKSVEKLRKQLKELTELSGIEYDFYFKVFPGSVGNVIKFVCEELNIEKDVTNYNNF